MRDAVIVLANLMNAAGHLNNESLSRLSLACELVRAGEAPVLVTCGWAYRNDSDIRIADAMAQHATQYMRLDKSQIIIEPHSRDTVGDAVFTKRNLVNSYSLDNVLVVTTAYHVKRTCEIFSFIYGRSVDVVGAEGQNSMARMESEAKSLAAFRSTFDGVPMGDDQAIYQRLITAHPFYNGEFYPAIS
jgi:uncharacterized SAM-binding protein YcdF (DUF218 family)